MAALAQKGLLKELAEKPESLFARPFDEQYGAVCYRLSQKNGYEVLLVTSRETRRWIIPKGWAMKGKKPHQVAEIEAWEEAGVKGKAKKKPIGFFTYVKATDRANGITKPCVVRVHLLRVSSVEDTFQEKGQRRRRWMSFSEAAAKVREPELKSLISVVGQKLEADTKH